MIGRIAGYELLEVVGRGGMGVVFRARDPRLQRIVALKVLPDALARDAEYRARFKREVLVEASLSHPSIATCFDYGEATIDPPELIPSEGPGPPPPRLYLTMEFVPGRDLSELVNGEPVAVPRVLDLVGQIAAGLEAAHAAGVVHRDLKPANVRITPDGRVKIVDFGLATTIPGPDTDTESFHTSHDRVMGTWHFMAPEQTHGRTIDPRSDLFSLGAILYLLVTSKLPFNGKTALEVVDSVTHAEPPPLARYANGVPEELERITRKLLAKDPDARYQSAHEVRTDLARLREGPSQTEGITTPFDWRLVFAALGAVLLLVVGWWAWKHFIIDRPWRTLAVVPFANHTGDPRLDYVSEGVAASLRTSLIRNSRLSVAAASTVQAIDPTKRTAKNLAHELGVDAMLTGSLDQQDGVLHLDLELVEGRHGFVIWGQGYDYDLAAGDDVERQIVRDIMGRGSDGPGPAPKSTKPRVSSAYDLVLRAAAALDDPADTNGPERALAELSKALDQDPDFALAWAWSSRAQWKLWDRDKSEESLRLAEEAANRAVRLNPELLEARLARAQVYRALGRYDESIRELTEVLSVNPNWDEAELHLAAAYRDAGNLDQAESHIRHATEVRPGYWRNWNSLGVLLAMRGNFPGAREAFRQVIHLVPETNVGYTQLAAVEAKTGNYDAAIALYDKLPLPVEDGVAAGNIGTTYFFGRRFGEAERYYALAARLDPRNINVWLSLGDLDTQLGRRDSALVSYANALQLADEQLHVNPKNSKLRMQRILSLAKLGRCDEVSAALAAFGSVPVDNADLTHQLAKAYATCGRRSEALAAARQTVALGTPSAVLHAEAEFAALKNDPAFPAAPAHKTP
ncbi:MAG TPA: protein kinase [Methylomirabilota bacterium]|nr:protein kinase [Methylomirabilota bacterium]